MALLAGIRQRLRALLRGREMDRELDAEIRLHLELEMEKHVGAGLSREEARRRARLSFGGTTQVREEHREARGMRWLEDAVADARYGLRALRRNPALAATAVLTLALGIGANVAIFSVVNAVMLRPLPFPQSGRLMKLSEDNAEKGWRQQVAAPANYLDWAERVRAFEGVAAYTPGGHATLTGDGDATMIPSAEVTGNFFAVLGVTAVRGRTFQDAETWQGGPHVAVISDRLWRSRFGADPAVVGRTVTIDAVATQVVGIVPARYRFPNPDVDLWRPMGWKLTDRAQDYFRRAHWLGVVARLRPGVTAEGADAQFQDVVRQLQRQYPETNRVMGADMVPLHDYLIGSVRPTLLVLLGAVGVLLFIACANVGNLLLIHALGRRQENALRLALGAGRGRLVRQALTESLVLSTFGALAGCALGWAGTRAAAAFQPARLLPVRDVSVDWRVLLFVVAITTASGLLFGIAPAVWRGRRSPADALREGGRGGSEGGRVRRWGHGLAVAEVSLALLLAVGAGLVVRSFWRLENLDPGFDASNVLTVGINLPGLRYGTPDKAAVFFDELRRRARALPGVAAAGLVLVPPLQGNGGWTSDYHIGGRPADQYGTEVAHRPASPDYFRVMRVRLVAGRLLSDEDRAGAPRVLVINEALARREFAGVDPIGQRIAFDKFPDSSTVWWTIVGVVGSERQTNLAIAPQVEVFEPFAQQANSYATLVVRTTVPPASLAPAIRRQIAALDPDLAVATLFTMEELRAHALATRRFVMLLLATFAGVGLVLAMVGVYGVVAQLARRRTREMGIRLALGATTGEVQWLVVRQGLRLAGAGVLGGAAAALVATRLLRSLLFAVSPTDPVTFVAVAGLLALSAFAASWLPAARAGRIDPASTLRIE